MTLIEQHFKAGKFKAFALMRGDDSFESKAISLFCTKNDIPCVRLQKDMALPDGMIPSGSVEWCIKLLGKPITPDYYPGFAQSLMTRRVWQTKDWPLDERVFIKPSDSYKRFTGFVKAKGSYRKKKRGPYWCSEVVTFVNEWRYYVTHGNPQLGHGYWYAGDEVLTPEAPMIYNITMPLNFCGAIDIGVLANGSIELVEVQHPFACGWYGKFEDVDVYMNWLYHGWNYMKGVN